ncbi:hypothetical protein SAMN05444682_115114 [Parapedobacter indicus]|uniref:Uncharacterized protein n=1 Tax=Parapedobacter indicus TaxID=1477437 RepID=A0A1I3V1Q1_9SPHI|nr:hypothetical protein CLV26_11564 [Parapedobacter indicus]SFJ88087.1 hypothetical protein SAMN05444682_115114 [Parapedobacter indicus]
MNPDLSLYYSKDSRLRSFEDMHMHILAEFGVEIEGIVLGDGRNVKYRFEDEELGACEYWPSSDKVHIHTTNEWISPGIYWLYKRYTK